MGVLESFASRNPDKLAMLFEQIIQSDEDRKLYDEMENKKDAANTQFELAKKKNDNISMQLKEKCLNKRVAEKYIQMISELKSAKEEYYKWQITCLDSHTMSLHEAAADEMSVDAHNQRKTQDSHKQIIDAIELNLLEKKNAAVEKKIQISKLKEEEILLQAELENTKNKSEDTEVIQWLTDEKARLTDKMERLTHQLEASSVTPVITFCLEFEAVKDLEENLLQLKYRRHKLDLRTRERQQKLEVINTLLDKYEQEKTEATDVIKNVNASIQQNEMSRSELEKQHYLLYKLKADKHESDTIGYLDAIEDALKFHIQGVRGRIGKICTWDNGDNLAVAAALHRYKDFVVVEDKETEEKCIKHIKDRHLSPQRFLRLKPVKPISEDAKNLMLVRDKIRCDPACHNAIQFAVGNTIVCDDEAERNRYIAKGYEVVSSNGLLWASAGGTMTVAASGGKDARSQSYNNKKTGIKSKIEASKANIKISEQLKVMRLKAFEASMRSSWLTATINHARSEQGVMKKEVSLMSDEDNALKGKISEIEGRLSEVENVEDREMLSLTNCQILMLQSWLEYEQEPKNTTKDIAKFKSSEEVLVKVNKNVEELELSMAEDLAEIKNLEIELSDKRSQLVKLESAMGASSHTELTADKNVDKSSFVRKLDSKKQDILATLGMDDFFLSSETVNIDSVLGDETLRDVKAHHEERITRLTSLLEDKYPNLEGPDQYARLLDKKKSTHKEFVDASLVKKQTDTKYLDANAKR